MQERSRRELREVGHGVIYRRREESRSVQPLHVALDHPLKALDKEASERHYEMHGKEYEEGKFNTMAERRVLLTHWVVEGWKELHTRCQPTIIAAFSKVGLSLKTNGSEDSGSEIKELRELKWENGGRRLPVVEMESQEDESAEAMSLFSEAKAIRLQDKRERAADAKGAQQAAIQQNGEVGGEIVDALFEDMVESDGGSGDSGDDAE